MSSFDDEVIADMRAHGGAVTSGPLAGQPLLIMTATGATSGLPRRAILTWSRDGESLVVAGTDGGSPADPAWVRNVIAHPAVTIEIGGRMVDATASVVADAAERRRLWEGHVAALPWFAEYPERSGRDIPMVRLTPDA